VAYLALNSGFAANVGGYSPMKKHVDRSAVYGMHHRPSDQPLNPWDAITAPPQPEGKPTPKKEYGQEHHTVGAAGSSAEKLSQLEAQYKAGLYSKAEYRQMKQELLRQSK